MRQAVHYLGCPLRLPEYRRILPSIQQLAYWQAKVLMLLAHLLATDRIRLPAYYPDLLHQLRVARHGQLALLLTKQPAR